MLLWQANETFTASLIQFCTSLAFLFSLRFSHQHFLSSLSGSLVCTYPWCLSLGSSCEYSSVGCRLELCLWSCPMLTRWDLPSSLKAGVVSRQLFSKPPANGLIADRCPRSFLCGGVKAIETIWCDTIFFVPGVEAVFGHLRGSWSEGTSTGGRTVRAAPVLVQVPRDTDQDDQTQNRIGGGQVRQVVTEPVTNTPVLFFVSVRNQNWLWSSVLWSVTYRYECSETVGYFRAGRLQKVWDLEWFLKKKKETAFLR